MIRDREPMRMLLISMITAALVILIWGGDRQAAATGDGGASDPAPIYLDSGQ